VDLIAQLSADEIENILKGNPADVYMTVRGSTVSEEGFVDHTCVVTNGDLVSIFESVGRDVNLVAGIVEEARLDTKEIASGTLSSSRPFPFDRELQEHIGKRGGAIAVIVAQNLRPAILSYVIHRFGNKSIYGRSDHDKYCNFGCRC